ncbi:MAG: orotidine-5'-phosphate decarboxylase [Proteobacteria bacterium]|nr:orotidine-5'-phosphate decarboxylase [Pseudomonadota bacterium]
MPLAQKDRLYVALDTADLDRAVSLARALQGVAGGVKLGKEFFTAHGPRGVERVAETGLPVFLDLKFHDIPNTVAGAVRAALKLKLRMLNVHAGGGSAMMAAAARAAAEAGEGRPLMLAVTVLTSLDDADLASVGVPGGAAQQVLHLARLARDSGLDGVVCSPLEAAALRTALGDRFALVVPGVRPTWAAADDQKRITTPAEAIREGAHYLVVGRPITGADDPAAAARRVVEEIAAA